MSISLKTTLQPLFAIYVTVTFAVSILAAFPFFVLISLGNNIAARRAIYNIIKWWSKCWLWVIGMPVSISGPLPPEKRYIIVANHISYLDAIVIFPGLPRYFRALGKKEVSRIPIVGFIYKQVVVLVDRTSVHSRAVSMRLLWQVLKKESDIIVFPEGTFNETASPLKEFYDGAFRLAITTQTDVLPVIFPDTVNRWHYSKWWKLWPGPNRAIYLEPVDVRGLIIENVETLKQSVHRKMEAALVQYQSREY